MLHINNNLALFGDFVIWWRKKSSKELGDEQVIKQKKPCRKGILKLIRQRRTRFRRWRTKGGRYFVSPFLSVNA